MKAITAISLFNGAGGLFMALDELNIPIKKLYISEIDKFANKAADLLNPNHIQLGDVTKWDEWEDNHGVDFGDIDLIMAGFPCQAWSLAGKQKGDDDPRGALVHDLLDMYGYIKTLNPDVKFMFENVAMKKEFMNYINNLFGCEPILINSALLTAQNRKRNYWSNWDITQPEDKGILLKDIIEGGSIDAEQFDLADISKRSNFGGFSENKEGIRPYKNDSAKSGFSEIGRVLGAGAEKAPTVTCSHAPKFLVRPCELRDKPPAESALCHHVATATDIKANESNKRIYADTGKAPTLTTMGGGHREPKVLMRSLGRGFNKGFDKEVDKTGTLTKNSWEQNNKVSTDGGAKYRKLTPRECMRLQGWPQWVIEKLLDSGISNSQLYKMCGNGWTHPVIVHNLRCLLDDGWMQD